MTWNDVVMQIIQYLVPVIGALLVALLGYVITLISRQQQKVKNDILRDALGAALAEAHVVGRDAIVATQQKLVDDLKAAAEDGKLTKEEAAQAMTAAKYYFVTHLSSRSKDVLKEGLGPIHEWLDSFLEAKLGEYKGGAYSEVQKLANPLLAWSDQLGPIRYGMTADGPRLQYSMPLGDDGKLNAAVGFSLSGEPRWGVEARWSF